MKLEICVKNNNDSGVCHFQIPAREEEAIALFSKLVDSIVSTANYNELVNRDCNNNTQDHCCEKEVAVREEIKPIKQVYQRIKVPEVEQQKIPSMKEAPKTVDKLVENVDKFAYSKTINPNAEKPTLVAVICPHCGKVHIGMAKAGDRVKCFNCREEIEIPKDLILTEYACASCGRNAYLYSTPSLDIITCSSCRAPIDIKYVDKIQKKLGGTLLR